MPPEALARSTASAADQKSRQANCSCLENGRTNVASVCDEGVVVSEGETGGAVEGRFAKNRRL